MSLHQELMNEAYELWQANDWSRTQFIMRLNWLQRVAVITGNFNYQVCNGGFVQWHDNGYSAQADELIEILKEIGTETTLKAADMVTEYMEVVEEVAEAESTNGMFGCTDDEWETLFGASNGLSDDYYKIDKQLLEDVEAFLIKEKG